MAKPDLISILYVSDAPPAAPDSDRGVESIVAASHERNARSGVSGALIYTGSSFAQVIEGPEDEVTATWARIAADPRHTRVDMIELKPLMCRRFEGWHMAYWGRVPYVERHLQAARSASPAERSTAAQQIINLMQSFVKWDGTARDGR